MRSKCSFPIGHALTRSCIPWLEEWKMHCRFVLPKSVLGTMTERSYYWNRGSSGEKLSSLWLEGACPSLEGQSTYVPARFPLGHTRWVLGGKHRAPTWAQCWTAVLHSQPLCDRLVLWQSIADQSPLLPMVGESFVRAWTWTLFEWAMAG